MLFAQYGLTREPEHEPRAVAEHDADALLGGPAAVYRVRVGEVVGGGDLVAGAHHAVLPPDVLLGVHIRL